MGIMLFYKANFNQIANLDIKIVLMVYSDSPKFFFQHILRVGFLEKLSSYCILAIKSKTLYCSLEEMV